MDEQRPTRPIRVWRYRGWCWVCRLNWPQLMPCSADSQFDTPGMAADDGRAHLRDVHGIEETR